MISPPEREGIPIDAEKSTGPNMTASKRGEAAQISSTFTSPIALSIWASIPICPTGSPEFIST